MGSVLVEAVHIFLKYIQNTLLRNLVAPDCQSCRTWLPQTANPTELTAQTLCPTDPRCPRLSTLQNLAAQTVYSTEPGCPDCLPMEPCCPGLPTPQNLAAQTVYPWNLTVLDCLPCKTWLPWTAYPAESGCPGPPTLQTVYPTEPDFHRTMVYMRLRVACLD